MMQVPWTPVLYLPWAFPRAVERDFVQVPMQQCVKQPSTQQGEWEGTQSSDPAFEQAPMQRGDHSIQQTAFTQQHSTTDEETTELYEEANDQTHEQEMQKLNDETMIEDNGQEDQLDENIDDNHAEAAHTDNTYATERESQP